VSLRWDQVDLKAGLLHVARLHQLHGEAEADLFQVGGTITGSGSSSVPQLWRLPAIHEARLSRSTGVCDISTFDHK